MRLILLSSGAPWPGGGLTQEARSLPGVLGSIMRKFGGVWLTLPGEADTSETLPPDGRPYQSQFVDLPSPRTLPLYQHLVQETLWPLCHGFPERVDYNWLAWNAFEDVNYAFAVQATECSEDEDVFWVHGVPLALVPKYLKSLRPAARVGLFWHVPWPSLDMLSALPWREILLSGVLSADVIGFQTQRDADELIRAACALLPVSPAPTGLHYLGRFIEVQVNPVGVDATLVQTTSAAPSVQHTAHQIRAELGEPPRLLLSLGELNYAMGITQQLRAFARLLEVCPEWHGRIQLMQVVHPAHGGSPPDSRYQVEVEALVNQINRAYGRPSWVPVRYMKQAMSPVEVVSLYLAADVFLVTPLSDGLNLAAKEFACTSQDGVLILSEFAGAAAELGEALLVNPHDEAGLVQAMYEALHLNLAERQRRMRVLREQVNTRDADAWARTCLHALSPALTADTGHGYVGASRK